MILSNRTSKHRIRQSTIDCADELCKISVDYQDDADSSINNRMIRRYRLLGRLIRDKETIMDSLSSESTRRFSIGLSAREHCPYAEFYRAFPDILNSLSSHSSVLSLMHRSFQPSTADERAGNWKLSETIDYPWSMPTLERNVDAQYRLDVHSASDMTATWSKAQAAGDSNRNSEFVGSPVVTEFLGLSTDLEGMGSNIEAAIHYAEQPEDDSE